MTEQPIRMRGNVVTPDGVLQRGTIEIAGGLLRKVASAEAAPKNLPAPTIDVQDGWVLPGFIDVHVHGGFGASFMEATDDAFETVTAFHGRHGTTSMLATTVTAAKANLEAVLQTAARFKGGGARLLGIHLEGPFISPRWPGAQNRAWIVPPNAQWMQEWLDRFPGIFKLVTLAPEMPGALALIERLSAQGVVCAAGHTDASYEQLVAAMERGLKHAVHAFNAMRGLHHRDPAAIGAVLTEERISAEIIADGRHVHAAVAKLLARTKTNGNLLLVTDAISAAGLPDGPCSLGGLDVIVQDGTARLRNGGNLAGSTLTMIDALRFMVRDVGLSVAEASRLASENPARLLGIDSITGSIQAGKAADLVLLTPELRIHSVWRGGSPIFSR